MNVVSSTGSEALAPSPGAAFGRPAGGWRRRTYAIIFEADTAAGRAFDYLLIVAILVSVAVVLVESVEAVARRYGPLLTALEWFFTVLFTVEYAARLACVDRPLRYAGTSAISTT